MGCKLSLKESAVAKMALYFMEDASTTDGNGTSSSLDVIDDDFRAIGVTG